MGESGNHVANAARPNKPDVANVPAKRRELPMKSRRLLFAGICFTASILHEFRRRQGASGETDFTNRAPKPAHLIHAHAQRSLAGAEWRGVKRTGHLFLAVDVILHCDPVINKRHVIPPTQRMFEFLAVERQLAAGGINESIKKPFTVF